MQTNVVKRNKWSSEMEELLMQVWQRKAAQFRNCRRNGHTYREMAMELQSNNFTRSAAEIKFKIQNFLSKYKNEKKKVESTGVQSYWRYYQTMEEILNTPVLEASESIEEESELESLPYLDENTADISIYRSPVLSEISFKPSPLSEDNSDRGSWNLREPSISPTNFDYQTDFDPVKTPSLPSNASKLARKKRKLKKLDLYQKLVLKSFKKSDKLFDNKMDKFYKLEMEKLQLEKERLKVFREIARDVKDIKHQMITQTIDDDQ